MKKNQFHVRLWTVVFLVIFCLAAASSFSEDVFPLIGDWAFHHAPENSVLLVREDGTAVYDGKDWTWKGDETFLRLTGPEGQKVSIRYEAEEDSMKVYLPGEYTRRDKLTDEEIWGAWIRDGSEQSSFVFEKDKRFLEDQVFQGNYEVDTEAGTILLMYLPKGYFADTLCYFDREAGSDHMTVYYPWPMTATKPAD